MIGRVGARFTAVALAVAGASVALVAPWLWSRWPGGGAWIVAGWAVTTAVGAATGAWLARALGRPDTGFLAALVTGMLVRLILVGVGLVVALRVSDAAAWGFLSGFAIAFVPLQVVEVVWSIRTSRRRPFEDRAARAHRGE